MAIKLLIDDLVKFTVKGEFSDRNGKAQPFSFTLTCDRLDAEAVDAIIQSQDGRKLSDFFAEITHDWTGVKDADDKAMDYSPEALEKLFKLPGVPGLAFRRYLAEIGAKEKN